jgi:phosphohistidine swiveling domain-containing protein
MLENKLSKSQWINLGRWTQPPLSGAFWSHWHEAKNNTLILLKRNYVPIIKLDGYTLIDAPQQERFNEFLTKLFDKKELGSFYKKFEHISQLCEKRHRTLLVTSKLNTRDYMAELFDSYLEMMAPWALSILLARELESIIREKKLAISDDEILAYMRPYYKPTDLERQSLEIKKLAQIIRSRFSDRDVDDITLELICGEKDIVKSLDRHVKEFAWFGTNHWNGEGYTLEKCFEDIRAEFKKDNITKKRNEAVQSDDMSEIWKLLSAFAYWRTHCVETTVAVVFHSRDKLKEVAQLWNMSYDELTYLTSKEILAGLDSGNFVKPENYEQRKKAYGCIVEDTVEHIIVDSELQEWISSIVGPPVTNIYEIHGSVASKGWSVSGKVRIIFGPRDFSNFSEGDILVASETTPDFVPLMKKAKAIVTDTGGITSHAAIMSREFGKPCIIGTKIATQVLKDGMLVEVDANEGVVKILET